MYKNSIPVLLAAFFLLIFNSSAIADPPSQEVLQQLKDEGRFDKYVEMMRDARSRGVDSPVSADGKGRASFKSSPNEVFRVLVLLIDYPDQRYTAGSVAGEVSDFDSLLFSDGLNPTGSMKEFYIENSYGSFVMEGDVFGWYTAANNYEYYSNYCDGSTGMGPYPNNAQKLVEEAILAADADVDFSLYDNNGDGYVDGLFVVHAGTSSSDTGNDCDIWSHKWNVSGTGIVVDGVIASSYSTEPEESPGDLVAIGVFCHEFGHVLGLPDLYDYDGSSEGCGNWAEMASGSRNDNRQTPAQFICWSKYQLGWLDPINVTSNLIDVDIPEIETNPVAYRLWRNGSGGYEYFLVENRQRIGFDAALPGDGLLIWHIDDSQWGNDNEWHPLVMLEQADGQFDLQYGLGKGDGADAYPNFGKATHFTDKTTPDSRDYINIPTQVAVWDIPASSSLMTVDLDVNWSRPFLALESYQFSDVNGGDGDGILEQGETIELTCTISNEWMLASSAEISFTVDDGNLSITTGTVSLGTIASGGSTSNSGSPLVFDIPLDYSSRVDSFFIEITSDGGGYSVTIPIEQNVGMPAILLIDDDYGDSLESYYQSVWTEKRIPATRWDKAQSGSPGISDLSDYQVVVWFTGYYRPHPLTAEDISAMKSYLDGGGNLFLTGQGIAIHGTGNYPSFLADYLHADFVDKSVMPLLVVDPGAQALAGIEDSIVISGYGGANNQTDAEYIAPVNGGVPEIFYYASPFQAAVSYSGVYKVVFFAFGFEAISQDPERFAMPGEVMERILDFFGVSKPTGFPEVTDVSAGPGSSTNLADHTPDISWVYYDEGASPQTEYQIEAGTDDDWSVAEMWSFAEGAGSETTREYAGSTLIDGQTYFYRVRVKNNLQWSGWMGGQFHMNMPPGEPVSLNPSGLTMVPSSTPDLTGTNAFNSDGGAMTYGFQVYDDDQLTNLITEVDGIDDGTVTTSWTVDVTLVEDQAYYWRMRGFDSFEYGEWSDSASFWVNAINSLPTAFDLILPENGALIEEAQPTLHWGKSFAGDLYDTLSYTILLDTSLLFATPTIIGPLDDTSHTLASPLVDGYSYFWKVVAEDLFSGQTESSSIFEMSGSVPGDANSDGGVNVGDAVFLINYVFKSGPPPNPLKAGDANGDCQTNIGDAVYLISYVFRGGAAPLVGCTP